MTDLNKPPDLMQPREKAAMLGVYTIEFFLEEFTRKQSLHGCQRREMLLFLATNMAAVTSRANQQCLLSASAQFLPKNVERVIRHSPLNCSCISFTKEQHGDKLAFLSYGLVTGLLLFCYVTINLYIKVIR